MIKRFIFISLVLLTFVFTNVEINAQSSDRMDVIVLLDSSRSMFQYYNQVVDYVLSGIVREYMRSGDAFHLLSFADTAQIEIAQVLRTESDLRSVIARLYLLYPLGKNTDLITSLKNIDQYVSDLPEGTTKLIILMTDGMHSPAAKTPYASLDPEGVKTELNNIVSKIRSHGWDFRIVRVPFTDDKNAIEGQQSEASSGAPGAGDYLSDMAKAAGTDVRAFNPDDKSSAFNLAVDLPTIKFPEDIGKQEYSFTIPADITNMASTPLSLQLNRLLLDDGRDILTQKEFITVSPGKTVQLKLKVELPENLPAGQNTLVLEPKFADNIRVKPARSTVNVFLQQSFFRSLMRGSARVMLFIILLVAALLTLVMLVMYVRKVQRKAEGPVVDIFIDSAARSARTLSAATVSKHVSPYANGSASTVASTNASAASVSARTAELAAAKASMNASQLTSQRQTSEAVANLTQLKQQKAVDSVAILKQATSQTQSRPAQAAETLSAWVPQATSRVKLPKADEVNKIRLERKPPVDYSPRVTRAGSARFVLTVHGQNKNIGKRNIHALHAGGRASLGSGKSRFLIFLLKVPSHLAWVYYDGVDITVAPIRPEFFPDYNGPINNCIGKDIRMITARGKELVFRFDIYEPPLDKLHRILHCIDTPGPVAI